MRARARGAERESPPGKTAPDGSPGARPTEPRKRPANRGSRSPRGGTGSLRKGARRPPRSRFWVPPASVLSSLMRWRQPTAAQPNSPPSTAPPRIDMISVGVVSTPLKGGAKRLEISAMEAIKFVVDTLLWLLMLAFVLPLLFHSVRPDFQI